MKNIFKKELLLALLLAVPAASTAAGQPASTPPPTPSKSRCWPQFLGCFALGSFLNWGWNKSTSRQDSLDEQARLQKDIEIKNTIHRYLLEKDSYSSDPKEYKILRSKCAPFYLEKQAAHLSALRKSNKQIQDSLSYKNALKSQETSKLPYGQKWFAEKFKDLFRRA